MFRSRTPASLETSTLASGDVQAGGVDRFGGGTWGTVVDGEGAVVEASGVGAGFVRVGVCVPIPGPPGPVERSICATVDEHAGHDRGDGTRRQQWDRLMLAQPRCLDAWGSGCAAASTIRSASGAPPGAAARGGGKVSACSCSSRSVMRTFLYGASRNLGVVAQASSANRLTIEVADGAEAQAEGRRRPPVWQVVEVAVHQTPGAVCCTPWGAGATVRPGRRTVSVTSPIVELAPGGTVDEHLVTKLLAGPGSRNWLARLRCT